MVARLHHLILDAADPQGSAAFWSALLGQPITYDGGDFVVVSSSDKHSGIAFQLAPDHIAPTWPDPSIPQQAHLDVAVDDVTRAGREVIALGARLLAGNTYADPAGHPFCLIPRPSWMSP
ncbi:VOC family protein [Aeromicrobium panaciterrae]|uniref:VOC family protein n=1 Tax=Aeromicrobium panaciterrae TaxID=363861 RepID=UPI0031D2B5AB